MKIVVDANVMISAALRPRSITRAAYERAKNHELLLSQSIIDEMMELFQRPKFDRYLPPHERMAFLSTAISTGTLLSPSVRITECRDATDDKYLELAVSGLADVMITGDPDLLVLHPFRGIPILSPADFLNWLPT